MQIRKEDIKLSLYADDMACPPGRGQPSISQRERPGTDLSLKAL